MAPAVPAIPAHDLYRAWQDAGNGESLVPLAHGLGLGAEPPLIGLGRGRDATLDEGMVLSVQSWVTEEGVGGCLERATVRIDSAADRSALTRYGRVVMSSHRTVFNHVGLCVADRGRSRRFYEELLGFQFWWELEPPDEGTGELLQLDKPVGLHATYLVRDGLVLELLDYSGREVRHWARPRDGRSRADPSVAVGVGPGRHPGVGRGLRGLGA